jgi:hypothetical protein
MTFGFVGGFADDMGAAFQAVSQQPALQSRAEKTGLPYAPKDAPKQ